MDALLLLSGQELSRFQTAEGFRLSHPAAVSISAAQHTISGVVKPDIAEKKNGLAAEAGTIDSYLCENRPQGSLQTRVPETISALLRHHWRNLLPRREH
jgi:hypothetical protein